MTPAAFRHNLWSAGNNRPNAFVHKIWTL